MATGAPDIDPSLAAAIAALRAGHTDDARSHAERSWQQSSAPGAAVMLAQLEVDSGRPDHALVWNERARTANPGNTAIELQAAHHLSLAGDSTAAFDRFAAVLRRTPRAGMSWIYFSAAASKAGRVDEAIAIVLDALRVEPSPAAHQALLNLLPETPTHGPPVTQVPPQSRQRISVVTCSVDNARFARVSASYARALADWPHEILRISDAKSLAEGYMRGLAQSDGNLVIFTHDDVEILPDDFGHRLARRIEGCDVLGVAGATLVRGPIWTHAGHPHLHGCVIYPHETGYKVTVYSVVTPIARDIRVMDGLFLAMPRAIAQRVGWDAENCTGFHGYDIDFSLRASKMGLRLAVASDLGVVHYSAGTFGDEWRVAAERLVARYPELRGPFSKLGFCFERPVADAGRALALADRWSSIRPTASAHE